MEELRTEIELRERKANYHQAQAELPFKEKLKILDELQEAAESIVPFRAQILAKLDKEGDT